MADAIWKQGKIRLYGNNSLLGWRVIPQSGGQAGRACCIGQTINPFFPSSDQPVNHSCVLLLVFSFLMYMMWDAEFLYWWPKRPATWSSDDRSIISWKQMPSCCSTSRFSWSDNNMVTPLHKHYLQHSDYLSMFSKNKFLEVWRMTLHSCLLLSIFT